MQTQWRLRGRPAFRPVLTVHHDKPAWLGPDSMWHGPIINGDGFCFLMSPDSVYKAMMGVIWCTGIKENILQMTVETQNERRQCNVLG